MKSQLILSALLLLVLLAACSSQYAIKDPTRDPSSSSATSDAVIQRGIDAYDRGSFQEAAELFHQVLADDSNNVHALYELALAYSALNQHQRSYDVCLKAMGFKWTELNKVYVLAGTELDYLGKQQAAADFYRQAIERYPRDHMLYYNLGITQLSRENMPDAKDAFKESVRLSPDHASGHLALGQAFLKEGNTVPALLACARFLVLEPSTERAEKVRETVLSILHGNVRRDQSNPEQITISLNPEKPTSEGDFGAITMYIALNSAVQLTQAEKGQSVDAGLREMFKGVFAMAGEIASDRESQGFVWQYYVPYFTQIQKMNFVGPFVDYAMMNRGASSDSVASFLKWSEEFQWEKGGGR